MSEVTVSRAKPPGSNSGSASDKLSDPGGSHLNSLSFYLLLNKTGKIGLVASDSFVDYMRKL